MGSGYLSGGGGEAVGEARGRRSGSGRRGRGREAAPRWGAGGGKSGNWTATEKTRRSRGREVPASRWCVVISNFVFTTVRLQVSSEALSTSGGLCLHAAATCSGLLRPASVGRAPRSGLLEQLGPGRPPPSDPPGPRVGTPFAPWWQDGVPRGTCRPAASPPRAVSHAALSSCPRHRCFYLDCSLPSPFFGAPLYHPGF